MPALTRSAASRRTGVPPAAAAPPVAARRHEAVARPADAVPLPDETNSAHPANGLANRNDEASDSDSSLEPSDIASGSPHLGAKRKRVDGGTADEFNATNLNQPSSSDSRANRFSSTHNPMAHLAGSTDSDSASLVQMAAEAAAGAVQQSELVAERRAQRNKLLESANAKALFGAIGSQPLNWKTVAKYLPLFARAAKLVGHGVFTPILALLDQGALERLEIATVAADWHGDNLIDRMQTRPAPQTLQQCVQDVATIVNAVARTPQQSELVSLPSTKLSDAIAFIDAIFSEFYPLTDWLATGSMTRESLVNALRPQHLEAAARQMLPLTAAKPRQIREFARNFDQYTRLTGEPVTICLGAQQRVGARTVAATVPQVTDRDRPRPWSGQPRAQRSAILCRQFHNGRCVNVRVCDQLTAIRARLKAGDFEGRPRYSCCFCSRTRDDRHTYNKPCPLVPHTRSELQAGLSKVQVSAIQPEPTRAANAITHNSASDEGVLTRTANVLVRSVTLRDSAHTPVTVSDALIDTGCSSLIMSAQLARQLNLPISAASATFRSIDGSVVATEGSTTATMIVGKSTRDLEATVVKGVQWPLIIGMHELLLLNASINLTGQHAHVSFDGEAPPAREPPVACAAMTSTSATMPTAEPTHRTVGATVRTRNHNDNNADFEARNTTPGDLSKVSFGDDMPESIKREFITMLNEYVGASNVIVGKGGRPKGNGRVVELKLLPDATRRLKEAHARSRTPPPVEQERNSAWLEQGTGNGIVEPCRAADGFPVVSPMFWRKKTDANRGETGHRPVTDLRATNAVTESNHYTSADMRLILRNLAAAPLFSVVDAASAYNAFVLDKNSRWLTTTAVHTLTGVRHVQYVRAPWALAGMGGAQQAFADSMVADKTYAEAMIDDFVLGHKPDWTPSNSEQAQQLKRAETAMKRTKASATDQKLYAVAYAQLASLLETFKREGVQIRDEKVQIALRRINVLGRTVEQHQIMPGPALTSGLAAFANGLKSKAEYKSLCDALPQLLQFAPNIAADARTIREAVPPGAPLKQHWSAAHEAALARIGATFEKKIALAPLFRDRPVYAVTDASRTGFAAWFVQQRREYEGGRGKWHIVACLGRAKPITTNAGAPYRHAEAPLEAELGALSAALAATPWLAGHKIVWHTDNDRVTGIATSQRESANQVILGRLRRVMNDFDVDIKWVGRKGVAAADFIANVISTAQPQQKDVAKRIAEADDDEKAASRHGEAVGVSTPDGTLEGGANASMAPKLDEIAGARDHHVVAAATDDNTQPQTDTTTTEPQRASATQQQCLLGQRQRTDNDIGRVAAWVRRGKPAAQRLALPDGYRTGQFELNNHGTLVHVSIRDAQRHTQVVVPRGSRTRVCATEHDERGHRGTNATLRAIRRAAWWPKMTKTITEYVRSCTPCQQTRQTPSRPGTLEAVAHSRRRGGKLHVDAVDIGNGQVLLVAVDEASGKVFAHTLANKKATTAASTFRRMYADEYGAPTETTLTDHGSEFAASVWNKLLRELGGAPLSHPTTANARANRAERANGELIRMLSKTCRDMNAADAAEHVSRCVANINNNEDHSTGDTANQRWCGITPQRWLDAATNHDVREPQHITNNLVERRAERADAASEAAAERAMGTYRPKVGDAVGLERAAPGLKGSNKISRAMARRDGPLTVTKVSHKGGIHLAGVAIPQSRRRVSPWYARPPNAADGSTPVHADDVAYLRGIGALPGATDRRTYNDVRAARRARESERKAAAEQTNRQHSDEQEQRARWRSIMSDAAIEAAATARERAGNNERRANTTAEAVEREANEVLTREAELDNANNEPRAVTAVNTVTGFVTVMYANGKTKECRLRVVQNDPTLAKLFKRFDAQRRNERRNRR